MKVHELKIHKEYFAEIIAGFKSFEIRKDDRDFEIWDELVLREFDKANLVYTGRFLHRRVDYILRGGQFGLEEGYVIMSFSKI
jgi:hypothetical protein